MLIHIDKLDDPRLAVYRDLKDRDLAREGARFIAESAMVVRRLLASPFPVESLLVTPRRAAEMSGLTGDDVPVYIITPEMMRAIVGFRLQSGVVACARRLPGMTLEETMAEAPEQLTLMILPETASTENLGAMVRIAAAFGCRAVVLGERSCDPYYRQAIRTSMGTVFSTRIVRSACLHDDLRALQRRWHVRLAATVLDPAAAPLKTYQRPSRLGVLFGNEAQGLSPADLALCDDRITIPMAPGADSLNVAVSAGIVMYGVGSSPG